METTKYYFEKENQGFYKTDVCTFLNRKFLSIECNNCDNCVGFDSEEKWVKCVLYANEFEISEFLKLVKESNNEIFILKEENIILQQRINELEGIVSDLKGTEE